MRILYLPLYTSKKIWGCSTYLWARRFFKRLVKDHRDVMVYFPIPEEEVDYVTEDMRDTDGRIILIPTNLTGKQRLDMKTYDQKLVDLFEEIGGKLFVDVVISDKPMVTNSFMNEILSYTHSGTGHIVIVNTVQFVIDKKYNSAIQDIGIYQALTGLAFADLNLFSLPSDIKRMMVEAERFLSPSLQSKVLENSRPYLGCIDDEQLKLCISKKKDDLFTVNWGCSLNHAYNVEEVFKEIDKLYCAGRKMRVLVTAPGDQSNFKMDRYKYFEMQKHLPQLEFWNKISKAHAFIYMPDHSEISYSVIEQQYLGLVGVFYDRKYLEGWLYPGYPFIAKSRVEIGVYLRQIYDNYGKPKVGDVIRKQRAWIKKHFLIGDRVAKVYDLLKEKYDEMVDGHRRRDGIVLDLRKWFRGKNNVTYKVFRDRIREMSKAHVDIENNGGRYGLSKSKWRRTMQAAGVEDTCTASVTIFKRVEK